jgi:hypothetical protein
MRRFSIRTLMAFVIIFAIGLAALRSGNGLWAGAMLFVALAAVGTAVLGFIIMRGQERELWRGFGVFCAGYLVLTFAPGCSTAVMPLLPTTQLLDYVHSQFIASTSQARLPQILWWQHERALAEVDRLKAGNRRPGDRELDSAMRMLINLETQLQGAADQRDFLRVGHSLFALIAGLLGGKIAGWFYARRVRAELLTSSSDT